MYVPSAVQAHRSLPRRQMIECGSSTKPVLEPHSILSRHKTNNNLVHGCLAQHVCVHNIAQSRHVPVFEIEPKNDADKQLCQHRTPALLNFWRLTVHR